MIVVMCMIIVVAFTVAAIMFARGRTADEEEGFVGPLPEKYVGSWELPGDSHVLQSPRTADLTEDEALADENDFGVTMTYGVYSTNRVGSISNPSHIIGMGVFIHIMVHVIICLRPFDGIDSQYYFIGFAPAVFET